MAQDLFRQSPSQWRNRHGPLTHGHPNLQAAAASRVGLPHGSGTLPSPPDCCTLSAPTADLTPELLRNISYSLAQWRHPDRHDIQPVQEILAKLAFGNK